ncbi:hypothetical protein H6G54_26340 [Anabaena cylindrica FACHB-243]|uniref:Uncharacterized protein n=1 Tax=Anabaena cylindrica (strain ATCC 27899 / PCC 7122) TaxID=272123 RepID=K9ZE25_ANACC|nr:MULTISPECIES: hypothetical protein [Anabaena]AFZ57463.1 hypothetical protein Anacy_1978 [Anabaena cylindrica PCC 7122]MBD2421144.1 hypothetical protein [Anabaena cylindrica FACHB-243]MBY5281149.1 hypothetical protein [Anabaena sp. CCAP 1446/1C]MBY5308559.1 hypothetical protein [Anabaena sp. CCAP 1446/1C]MCM2405899.1 hypothetical protein [Anabaena sp. CCAP 1446/1C]
MKPETEQRLGTLEVLLEEEIRYSLPCHEDSATLQPYAWDATIKGQFTPLNLIKSEGWIIETDPEVACENWLWTEQNGLASSLIYVYHKDPEKFLLDEPSKNKRYQQYFKLLRLLAERIKDLQAFSFSYNSHYSLSVVVGRVPDSKRWICLSSTVPQETPKFINELIHCSPYKEEKQFNLELEKLSKIERKINNIIKELGNIRIYGYYDGGYHHIHHHSIVLASGDSQEEAIKNALLKAGLVEIYKVKKFMIQGNRGWGFSVHDRDFDKDNVNNLIKFLHTMFPKLLLYRFCFWDYEHLYILGETDNSQQDTSASCVGVAIHSQFTYNP